MFKGIAYALSACFIWGLIFIVPQFMEGFSSLEVALGRYLFYGIISSVFLLSSRSFRFPTSVWIKAFTYALIVSISYYTCVVLALRYSSPAIAALILGIGPISIAVYGNWKERECHFKSLIFPVILIFTGLTIINLPHFSEAGFQSHYLIGLCCSILALTAWTWYAVSNSRFLKNHPEIGPDDWSTLIGVASLCWVLVIGVILGAFFGQEIEIEKYYTFDQKLISFLVGGAVLGFLCSWLGGSLWNRACLHLPISLAGQLTIFETIFGLYFVYLLEMRFPPIRECMGISLFLLAIFLGIHGFSEKKQKEILPLSS